MKPIVYKFDATNTANTADPILLNTEGIQQQLHLQTVWLNSGAGNYTIQGNLGMPNPAYAPGSSAVQDGRIIPNPDGWFDIQAAGTAAVRLGTGQLQNFIPVTFLRVLVNTLTAGQLEFTVLQQSIR